MWMQNCMVQIEEIYLEIQNHEKYEFVKGNITNKRLHGRNHFKM